MRFLIKQSKVVLLIFFAATIAFLLNVAGADRSESDSGSVRDGLVAFLEDKLAPDQLVITYTDLHGLWGGIEVTIDGTGKVRQQVVRREFPSAHDINSEQIDRLVHLLIKLEAWKQKVPHREELPDESRAYIRIKAGSSQSKIWEWYNDLQKTNRLIQIIDLMKEMAWEQNP